MSKRSVFTNVTPLPAGISRETVMETLRDHLEMIDLNPLVEERHPIKPPPHSTPEEYHCLWYSLTDRIQYLPGGLMSGKVNYSACFHDLENGLQTHCYAPMGLNIKAKWTVGGSLPGEPVAPIELGVGAPITGLWLREDVDMKCNIMMTSFVKKTLKKAHAHLVDRLVIKAQIIDATLESQRLSTIGPFTSNSQASTEYEYSPSDYGDAQGPTLPDVRSSSPGFNPFGQPHHGPRLSTQSNSSSSNLGLNENINTLHAHAQIQSVGRNSSSSFSSNNLNANPNSQRQSQDRRASWQNLNVNQNQTRSQSPAGRYEAYRAPELNYHAVELHSGELLKQGNGGYRGQRMRPTGFSAVELE
jgi:hypothetical protein